MALSQLGEGERKQRPVLLFDLATAQASADAAQALATATEACDLLDHDCYATALDRLPAVRAALRGTPHVAALEERVRALARASDS